MSFAAHSVTAAGAAGISWILASLSMPLPHIDGCEVFKVARKPVTAYVLNPPHQPAPVFAPPMVKPKEAEPEQVTKLPEIESKPEATNTDERPRRRHRRHRRWR